MSFIARAGAANLVIAALVNRLGGAVEITQDEIDVVAYSILEEEGSESRNSIILTLRGRTEN